MRPAGTTVSFESHPIHVILSQRAKNPGWGASDLHQMPRCSDRVNRTSVSPLGCRPKDLHSNSPHPVVPTPQVWARPKVPLDAIRKTLQLAHDLIGQSHMERGEVQIDLCGAPRPDQ